MSYISKEEAVKAINDIMTACEITHKFRSLRKRITKLPAADVAEMKWISVEDRLPEKGGKYLVHYHDDITGEYVITREYWEKAGKFAPMEYHEVHTGRRAVHWMPLPEPPEGGVQE